MTSGLFILRLFQHLHGFMKQENKLFYSNQERFSLVCLDKSTILSVFFFFFHLNLKKNVWMFYTFDRQTLIGGCYFKQSS